MMMMMMAHRQVLQPPARRHLLHGSSKTNNPRALRKRFRHTLALCRDLPNSFHQAVSIPRSDGGAAEPVVDVSLDLARQQLHNYVACLRQYIPTLCLPALELHPDCVFVEDTVVVLGRRAVITRPGHESRRGEVNSIRTILEQLGIEIVTDLSLKKNVPWSSSSSDNNNNDNSDNNTVAQLDGGDVLFTGRHLFVGMSTRTNLAACQALQEAFPDVEVVAVDLPPPPPSSKLAAAPVLHLKSAVTHLDAHTLLIPEGWWGDALLQALQANDRGYDQVVRLPNILACNAVVISNQHVVAQDTPCTISRQRLIDAVRERNMTLDWIDTSELAKKDAALTCCSVLLEL